MSVKLRQAWQWDCPCGRTNFVACEAVDTSEIDPGEAAAWRRRLGMQPWEDLDGVLMTAPLEVICASCSTQWRTDAVRGGA